MKSKYICFQQWVVSPPIISYSKFFLPPHKYIASPAHVTGLALLMFLALFRSYIDPHSAEHSCSLIGVYLCLTTRVKILKLFHKYWHLLSVVLPGFCLNNSTERVFRRREITHWIHWMLKPKCAVIRFNIKLLDLAVKLIIATDGSDNLEEVQKEQTAVLVWTSYMGC